MSLEFGGSLTLWPALSALTLLLQCTSTVGFEINLKVPLDTYILCSILVAIEIIREAVKLLTTMVVTASVMNTGDSE